MQVTIAPVQRIFFSQVFEKDPLFITDPDSHFNLEIRLAHPGYL